MNTTKREGETLNGRVPGGPELNDAIRGYVRTYVLWHGRQQAAETLGISRHTLWRFLERSHVGRAVPCAVIDTVGGSAQAIEAATRETGYLAVSPETGPCTAPAAPRPWRIPFCWCAPRLWPRWGNWPASDGSPRPPYATGCGSSPSGVWWTPCAITWAAWGRTRSAVTSPRNRASTPEGWPNMAGRPSFGNIRCPAGGSSYGWRRLDAIAVFYYVAALVADADPHKQPVRVDHYRQGPYDVLLTLSGGRSLGLLRQGSTLPSANLRTA